MATEFSKHIPRYLVVTSCSTCPLRKTLGHDKVMICQILGKTPDDIFDVVEKGEGFPKTCPLTEARVSYD